MNEVESVAAGLLNQQRLARNVGLFRPVPGSSPVNGFGRLALRSGSKKLARMIHQESFAFSLAQPFRAALQGWVPESETRPARFQRAFQRTGFSHLATGG